MAQIDGKVVKKVRVLKKKRLSEELTVPLLQYIIAKAPTVIKDEYQLSQCENCDELCNLDRFALAEYGYNLCYLCKHLYPPKRKYI